MGEAKPGAVTANVVIDTRPLRADVRAGVCVEGWELEGSKCECAVGGVQGAT